MATRLQQLLGGESVLLRLSHSNLKTFSSEIQLSLQTTVESVKEKLWRKWGMSVDSMCLKLYYDTGSKVSNLDDHCRPLGFYSPLDGLGTTLNKIFLRKARYKGANAVAISV